MSADPKPLQKPDPLDAAADQVIAARGGDVRAAARALIIAKGNQSVLITKSINPEDVSDEAVRIC